MPTITTVLEFDKCSECPHSKVISTPDPTDSFNSDDCALVCTKVPNPYHNEWPGDYLDPQNTYDPDEDEWNNEYRAQFEFRPIDVMCRPYEIRKCEIPNWCPLEK